MHDMELLLNSDFIFSRDFQPTYQKNKENLEITFAN